MAIVLITGGTGMIGTALSKYLVDKGHEVIILTRSRSHRSHTHTPGIGYAEWDIQKKVIDRTAIEKSDHIIHLAGAGIGDKRWTRKRKKEIVDSRVESGKLIARYIKEVPNKVSSIVSASGIGWYGPDPGIPNPHPFTEDAPADKGFLGATCEQWEKSLEPVKQSGIRLVNLRTGIVLSSTGGALCRFITPLRFGIASILGNGRQVISWIHIDDLVRMYTKAISDQSMEGPFNAVSPLPFSNKEFVLQLARTRNRFFVPMYIPSFVLKIVLGEMSIEALKSATLSAEKMQQAGFRYSFPFLEEALQDLLHKK